MTYLSHTKNMENLMEVLLGPSDRANGRLHTCVPVLYRKEQRTS